MVALGVYGILLPPNMQGWAVSVCIKSSPRWFGEKNVSTMRFFGVHASVTSTYVIVAMTPWHNSPSVTSFDKPSFLVPWTIKPPEICFRCISFGRYSCIFYDFLGEGKLRKKNIGKTKNTISRANAQSRFVLLSLFRKSTWIAESTQKENLIWVPLSGWYIWHLKPPTWGF